MKVKIMNVFRSMMGMPGFPMGGFMFGQQVGPSGQPPFPQVQPQPDQPQQQPVSILLDYIIEILYH